MMKISLPFMACSLWLLAFICSFTWVSIYETEFVMGSLAFLIIAMAVNDASGIKTREWKYPVSPVLLAGGGLWLMAAVSVAASPILFISWIYFFVFSALPLSVVFFLIGDNFESRLQLVWRGLKVVFSILSLYAIYQYFFMPQMLFKGRVHEPLTDPNGLAAIFSLGIFMLAGDIVKKATKFKAWDAVLLFLMISGFFTTGSRAAFLFLAIMALVFLVMTGVGGIGKRNWIIFSGTGLAALILIGVIYTPDFYSGPIKVLQYTSEKGLNGIFNERGMIWQASVELVKAHPWFGTGPGTFPLYYAELRSEQDMTAGYMVHNDPLQFAVEMGILAPVFFYMVCVLAISRSYSVLKKMDRNDDRRLDIIAPLSGLAAMVLHSHLTFNFHALPCLMLAGFAFASWYRATAVITQEKMRTVRAPGILNKTALESLFLIIAFIVTTMVVAPLYSQKLAASASDDMLKGDLPSFGRKVNLSDALSLGTNPDAYVLAANVPLGILEQKEAPVSKEDQEKFMEQARVILEKGHKANPRDASIIMLQAKLAKLEGRTDEQIDLLREAVRMDPYHMSSRMALGAQLERMGKIEEAYQVMSAGLEKKYGRKDAQNYLEYYLRTMRLGKMLEENKK